MSADQISVAQYKSDVDGDSPIFPPLGDSYVISDTAAHIETLTPHELGYAYIGLQAIQATDDSIVFDVNQATPLAFFKVRVSIPRGNSVTVADTAANILGLDPDQVLGRNGHTAWSAIGISALTIADTAANLESLSTSQITLAHELDVTTLRSTDVTVLLSAAEATDLGNAAISVTVPTSSTVILYDTAASLQAMTPEALAALPQVGVAVFTATGNLRPLFNLDQEAALGGAAIPESVPTGPQISVSDLQNMEANQGVFIGDDYDVVASVSDIETNVLTAGLIAAAPANVGQISTDDSVAISVDQALALESASMILSVPSGDSVTVVDTAARLEALSVTQLEALGFVGVTTVAASDAVPVFDSNQKNALFSESIGIVAPPNDPGQNDGTIPIFRPGGNGMTFLVTWGPSVASAQPGFEIDLEKVLQFYADTFVDPNPVHIVIEADPNDASNVAKPQTVNYADVTSALKDGAASQAQFFADANLPATGPAGDMIVKSALAGVLGRGDTASIDGTVSLGVGNPLSYSSEPSLGAGINPDLAAAAHEISEVLGRDSALDSTGGSYSLIDLFRYAAPNTLQTTTGGPSYFSIDDGNTNLIDFNNQPNGDLADFSGTLGGKGPTIQDAFDTGIGGINPITAVDITTMNVLGYNLAAPTADPTLPNATALPVTVGELLVDETVDLISPGENKAPAGYAYVVTDTAFAIELLTPDELTAGAAMGVAELYATDASVFLDVAQVEALAAAGVPVVAPSGSGVIVSDSAANIEGLSVSQIDALTRIGVTSLTAVDASVTLTMTQALELARDGYAVAVPTGDTVSILDSSDAIALLTPGLIGALSSVGVRAIKSNDKSIVFDTAQAVALAGARIVVSAPAGDTVTVADTFSNILSLSQSQLHGLTLIGSSGLILSDTAANIEAIAAVEMTNFPGVGGTGIGITAIVATDASVVLDVDQATSLEGDYVPAIIRVTAPPGDTVSVADTAANIESLTPTGIFSFAALPGIGVSGIRATDTGLMLTVAQVEAIEGASLAVEVPSGDTVTIADTAANIETLTAAQIATLPAIGVSAFLTSNTVSLGVSQAVALERTGMLFNVQPGQGLSLYVTDTAAVIESLTPAQISALSGLLASGLYEAISATGGSVTFTIAQGLAVVAAKLGVYVGFGDSQTIADTASNIEALTLAQIADLRLGGWSSITATTSPVTLTAAQAVALEGTNPSPADGTLKIVPPLGGAVTIALADTAANIEALTPAQLAGLIFLDVSQIKSTDTSLAFNVDQAETLEQQGFLGVVLVPAKDVVTITDTAAAIEGFLAQGATPIADLPYTINRLVSNLGSVAVTVSEAEALESARGTAYPVSVSAPAGDSVFLADTAAHIAGMSPTQLDELTSIGVTAITVTDPALNVKDAEALESTYAAAAAVGTPLPLGAPAGESLILKDTAADIEGMSPAQLGALTSIGVNAVMVTDQSITLSVAQTLALYDPVPISVPAGDKVFVADTETEIDSLTPAEVAGLAAIGVNTIEVSNLTGAGPLTIDGGITLSVDGAVPSNETITFAGAGGVLELDDTVGMAGTIYGFSPPDTIDLTDVPYDSNGTAGLATDPNDSLPALQVVENGNTYYLDIDPSQVFLTAPTFELNPDGGDTGSDLTVAEPPVTSYVQLGQSQTADGVVVASGGEVEALYGATVNRAIVESGGVLMADDGATINDTVLNDGTVDFDIAGSAVFRGPLSGRGILDVSGGGALDVTSAYTGAAQVDGSSTMEFTSNYFGVVTFGGSSTGPGGTLQFDAGSIGPITVTNPNDTVIAQPGSNNWINAAVTGNSPNDTFVVYNSSDVVLPKAGSHDVVYSAVSYTLPTGVDVLILEAGTQAVGNSDAAGDALYAANPSQTATLIGNSANDTFVVYNSADVVVPKAGSHDVVYSAVSYTLPTGVDSLILEAGTQAFGNSDASGDTLYAADAGSAQTLTGNSHNDTFVVYNSADVLIGQVGSTDTAYSAANFTLPTNVDTLFLEGPGATLGTGNNDAFDTLFGNAGVASTLVAAGGADTLYVTGTAGTIMTGGAGADTFAFPNAMGHDEVTNFGIAKDTLQFNAALFSNFTAAMNAASQSGANTVFTIDANDTVTLDNVTKTSLTAGNFHFT